MDEELQEKEPKLVLDTDGQIRLSVSEEGVARVDDNGTTEHFWLRLEVPFRVIGECEEIPEELITLKARHMRAIARQLTDEHKAHLESWMEEPPVEI